MQTQSRRKFLQDGSVAVASGVLGSQLSQTVSAATGERIRVGIIGRTGKGDYGHGVDVAFTKLTLSRLPTSTQQGARLLRNGRTPRESMQTFARCWRRKNSTWLPFVRDGSTSITT